MEAATSRMIRIGTVSIGLIGLDMAINQAVTRELTGQQAEDFLFSAVQRQNYIPSGQEEQYRAALRQAYRKHLHPDAAGGEGFTVRIFGPGCVACNGLHTLVLDVMARLHIAADIEQIHDPDEIGRAGILHTPALMIGGKLRSMGQHPTPAQVEQWIKEAAATY